MTNIYNIKWNFRNIPTGTQKLVPKKLAHRQDYKAQKAHNKAFLKNKNDICFIEMLLFTLKLTLFHNTKTQELEN